MPTVQEIIDDIDVRTPNGFTHAEKVNWINDVIKKVYRHAGIKGIYDFTLETTTVLNSVSTNIKMQKIERVLVSDSTAIADIDADTVWQTYKFSAPENELTGYKYYKPNREECPSTDLDKIGFYPASTEGYVARIYYDKVPDKIGTDTTDSTTIPELKEDYHDIIKYGTMEIIATAGINPDVSLRNNYHMEYLEELHRIKLEEGKIKEKLPRKKKSYKEWL